MHHIPETGTGKSKGCNLPTFGGWPGVAQEQVKGARESRVTRNHGWKSLSLEAGRSEVSSAPRGEGRR